MSLLGRRVQVLVDSNSYARLEWEAQATGTSVEAIVRYAIDGHLERMEAGAPASAAARRVLESTAEPHGTEPDRPESKAAIVARRAR